MAIPEQLLQMFPKCVNGDRWQCLENLTDENVEQPITWIREMIHILYIVATLNKSRDNHW